MATMEKEQNARKYLVWLNAITKNAAKFMVKVAEESSKVSETQSRK
jgi:hypothetical protein